MKKVILASVLATAAIVTVDAQAATASVCSGGNAVTASVSAGGTSSFIKNGFSARCSNNVILVSDDNQTYYRVGAASVKGKNAYGGSTNGGAIAGTACSGTACVQGDAAAAATNAASS